MATVVVIGGAGFLGGNLIPELLEDGHKVRVIDVVPPDGATRLAKVAKQIDYRWASVLDFDAEMLELADVVLYLAAQADVPLGISSPMYTFQQNVMSTVHYMHVLSRLSVPPRTVYMSSESVYGVVPRVLQPIKEDAPLNPTNAYAVSKMCAESVVRAYAAQYEIPVVVLRSTTMYGPASRTKQVVPIFIRQALAGKDITVEGDGSQSRDFNYVGNMVSAIRRVLAQPAVTGTFNIGSNREMSIKQLAEAVIGSVRRTVGPTDSKVVFGPWRPGEKGIQLFVSSRKAAEQLGYEPQISLEHGLDLTTTYWKDQR